LRAGRVFVRAGSKHRGFECHGRREAVLVAAEWRRGVWAQVAAERGVVVLEAHAAGEGPPARVQLTTTGGDPARSDDRCCTSLRVAALRIPFIGQAQSDSIQTADTLSFISQQ
jgi:hypothetical protein